VTIPESITKIGEKAFYNCANLKSVEIPKKLAGTKIANLLISSGVEAEALKEV